MLAVAGPGSCLRVRRRMIARFAPRSPGVLFLLRLWDSDSLGVISRGKHEDNRSCCSHDFFHGLMDS